MQLSIELLPAPLGPMIARTSCSRTSKLMSVSAFTPPKLSEMFCTSRMTLPIFLLLIVPPRPALRSCRGLHRREPPGLDHLERRAHHAGAAILELHLRLHVLLALAAV